MPGQNGRVLPYLDEDGVQFVLPYPASPGWKTWFTGRGDLLGPPVQRGLGAPLRLTFAGPEKKTLEIQFVEPVEVHDGQSQYSPLASWSMDDRLDFGIRIPATATTANGGGTGNCNLVPSGLGYDLIVPANGDGACDVVLAAACPVPVDESTGYWDVDYATGAVTPSATPGVAKYHLLALELVIYFCRQISLGNPRGLFDVETYSVNWIHPNWLLHVVVDKVSAGAGEFGAWLMCFRRNTT